MFHVEDMCAAAASGAVLLDERYSDWPDEIDVEELDMGNPFKCILGHLYGSFTNGMNALGLDFGAEEDVKAGFDLPRYRADDVNYAAQTTVWSALIAERLN